MVLTSRAGPTASAHNGVRSPDDLSHGLPWSMGEERRRDLMASAFPVGSSAAIDFTAGEMTLLRALIAGPPTLNRHPLSREFCRGIGWFKPDSGLKDMMARVAHAHLLSRHGMTERLPSRPPARFAPSPPPGTSVTVHWIPVRKRGYKEGMIGI